MLTELVQQELTEKRDMSINPKTKDRASPLTPAGAGKRTWLAALEQGANLLQTTAPLKNFDVYVVGFHCAKGEPDFQMEAHHFCKVVNDDLLQCVLFDGNTKDANLIGIEYIVSGRLLDQCRRRRSPTGTRTTSSCCPGSSSLPGCPRPQRRRSSSCGQLLRQDLAHLAHRHPPRPGHGPAVRRSQADVVVQPGQGV